ncbi:DUF4349 domain-containing protein [Micromonospora sp. Llam0]|uniref:DUF4349 domain-containing protein n=1 Tax=Micromonospora sp. Llam0 TaxID=2485143 RepID=UPI001315777D|nr:DUF4349 domain-containing protein [Micromonospora sp. Llam0]
MNNGRRGRWRTGGRRGTATGTAALLALLILAGCSGSEDSGVSSSADMPQRAEPAPAGGAPGDGGLTGGDDAGGEEAAGADTAGGGERGGQADRPDGTSPVDLAVGNRSIIYSGSITVQVTDVPAKAGEAATIATSVGGFVGRDQRSEYESYGRATLELRVPAEQFDRVVDRLSRLGEEVSRELTTQDVTEEVLDLDARITTQQARVRSGRALLAEAETLADLVMLESELAKREADLASLEARKRGLDDLVTLSRITVELIGPDATPPVDDESELGFLAGLGAGWRAFVGSMQVLVTVVGALLPWLIALGVPALGVFWLVRTTRGRSRPVAAATAPAGGAPAAAAAGGAAVPTPRRDDDGTDGNGAGDNSTDGGRVGGDAPAR